LIFHTTFRGRYIGGQAIIVAEGWDEALKLLREKMDEFNWLSRSGRGMMASYDEAAANLTAIDKDEPGVFHFEDGDY